jgi:Zn-dependent membrane protease YugP
MSTALIWIIMIAVMAASYIIQNSLQRRFDKYAKIPTSTGLSGAEIARKMLQENGIYDVKVE